MSGLYDWLRQTWSSLVVVADMSEQSTATADESEGCQIYSDALDQLMLEYDQLCDRIDWNLDHLWECRKAKALAESVGTEDDREVVHFTMPGLSVRITDRTLQTIGQYTGKSWMAVVFAIAIAIILYALAGFYRGGM